jgi:hypothetical protein
MVLSRVRLALAPVAVALILATALRVQPSLATTEDVSSKSATALEQLAAAKFGALSEAERRLVLGAPFRDLRWAGPNKEPNDVANDAHRGDKWGPERTIRAELLSWLSSDPAATGYVDPSGLAIAAARIDGKLDLSYSKVPKTLTLVRCYLPAGVDLSNAEIQAFYLRDSVSGPISADSANVNGDVGLQYGSYGAASFFRSHIGGNLDCTGARFLNSRGNAVFAAAATIAGDALFHEGFTADGVVDLRLAKIGGSLSFNDVRFTGGVPDGLNAERATVEGSFYWVNVEHGPNMQLDLENTRTGALWDDEPSWPSRGNLAIAGFVYGGIAGGPADAQSRLRWLSLQPAGYHPQPYRQLATALREHGEDSDATDVLIAKEAAKRRYGGLSRVERIWSLVLDATIGYGYRPLRALWWILGFVALGTVLFGAGYRRQVVTPSDANAYQSFVADGAAPAHYPPFNAFIYSLDNFIPIVDLHQGLYWRPNPRPASKKGTPVIGREIDLGGIAGSLLRWYLWFHILVGWILTPLLFAGLSGLIRVD